MKHIFFKTAGEAFINYLDSIFKYYSDAIGQQFPIYINNTGDEPFLSNLQNSGKNDSRYQFVPRMILDVQGFSLQTSQLTSPRVLGKFVNQSCEDFDVAKRTKVRRLPIDWTFAVEVRFSNILEFLQFTEIFYTVSYNNHYFTFYYAGTQYSASFFLQEDIESNANLQLQFDTDKRHRVLPLTFVLHLQYPAFDLYDVGNPDGTRDPEEFDENEKMMTLIHNMHDTDPSDDGIFETQYIRNPLLSLRKDQIPDPNAEI
jgi:hypothetical protein